LKRKNSILFPNSRIIKIYLNKLIHDRTFVNVRETGPDDFGLSVRVWFVFKRKKYFPDIRVRDQRSGDGFYNPDLPGYGRVRGFGWDAYHRMGNWGIRSPFPLQWEFSLFWPELF
jgi:hypothetical protein